MKDFLIKRRYQRLPSEVDILLIDILQLVEIANVTRDDKRGTGKRKGLSKVAGNQLGVEQKNIF